MNHQDARNGQRTIAARAARALMSLGVVASISACDANYQPLCTTNCLAGGGDEYIGGGV